MQINSSFPLDTILFLSLQPPIAMTLVVVNAKNECIARTGRWSNKVWVLTGLGAGRLTEVGTDWDSGVGTQVCACGVCLCV